MDDETLLELGKAKHEEIFGEHALAWRERFGGISQDAVDFLMKYCFGAYYTRPGLDLKTRELCTVTALAVLARWPQLKSHIGGALRVGATKEEITEVLLQMENYAGWPITLVGLETASEAFKAWDEKQKKL